MKILFLLPWHLVIALCNLQILHQLENKVFGHYAFVLSNINKSFLGTLSSQTAHISKFLISEGSTICCDALLLLFSVKKYLCKINI